LLVNRGLLSHSIRVLAFADTGGICPLLWRPLVSLLALDIPAYRIDLTAFAGLLNDGSAHNFSFDVVDGDPPRSSGVWYIDPVLIYELDTATPSPEYSGAVTDASCLDPAAAAKKRVISADPETGITSGSMGFTVSGTNTKKGDAEKTLYSHTYTLAAENTQPSDGPTVGHMHTDITSSRPALGQGHSVVDTQDWSYTVEDDSDEDPESGTFLLKAKVSLEKKRAMALTGGSSPLELTLVLAQNNSGLCAFSGNLPVLLVIDEPTLTDCL